MLKRESAGQMVYKRAGKRPREEILEIEDVKVYKFKVLLVGIGASVNVTCIDPKEEMLVKEFVGLVKMEYLKPSEDGGDYKRPIMWESKEIWLEDVSRERKIRTVISFRNFQPNKCYFLKLYDGSKEIADTFENMWDLTPDTDMLLELPQEYTFYTALADLIDNSLQAVWSNSPDERRLISVTIDGTGISIFDTGPGMDGNDETSIVKWYVVVIGVNVTFYFLMMRCSSVLTLGDAWHGPSLKSSLARATLETPVPNKPNYSSLSIV
ncbi:hypothetical protein GIB67_033426 [Kingdonia uniflora]|uniref:Uncharacterized protein n=1 Tax=Kingdonia uniflora TaxID=39325 RepID=A0A7J7LU17_9MAGN|nr:hypothetical protein GIB67_033426 [Kingdonia uniflora]